MRSPRLSVIVPMFKSERYLPRCAESLRSQTLDDIEIIFVDDGSPDRCGELAEGYAHEDPRISVVRRSNGGPASARNAGMAVATGEYLAFADSDDWVEPDLCERLYVAAEQSGADIVYTGFKLVCHDVVTQTREHPCAGRTLHGQREIFSVRRGFFGAAADNVADDPTPVSVWGAIYRRSLIEKNGIRFVNVFSEDRFFNIDACRAAERVTCISGSPYCYRNDDQPSVTKTFGRERLEEFFRAFWLLGLFADDEPDEFWDECHERSDRCVIDYGRVLVRIIEASSLEDVEKVSYVREVLNQHALRRACRGFPFYRLPRRQALFFLVLRLRLVCAARLLMKLRGCSA